MYYKDEILHKHDSVEELLDSFDFEKAHALFEIMGWTYRDNEHIPSVKELRKTAEYLCYKVLEDTKEDEFGYLATGRFEVLLYSNDREMELNLIFDSKSNYV